MTETCEPETLLEVLALIDRGLGVMSDRNLVPSSEISDLLLDVRSLLTRPGVLSVN